MKKILRIGMEDFKKMIDCGSYYVDKTDFIARTLNDEIALYTRPRRFGKTLNMSMLKYFYAIQEKNSAYLFEGLNISRNEEARKHQNQYPVISVTFKDITDRDFRSAINTFSSLISELVRQNRELFDSEKLSRYEKKVLQEYEENTQDLNKLKKSIYFLCSALFQHYGKKVVILIDEYDVPLNFAGKYGYYDDMVDFLRTVLSRILKTNPFLEKAILTGCLRISEESVITGLNNISVYSLTDQEAADAFGFTQDEVDAMYRYYHMEQKLPLVRDWYDGYRFGNLEIYNPWSAVQYLSQLQNNPDLRPVSFRANSGSNDIILDLLKMADNSMRNDLEILMKGGIIQKPVHLNLTYRDLDNPENAYSFLLLTGYLKPVQSSEEGATDDTWGLQIPNKEVLQIYKDTFSLYFNREVRQSREKLFHSILQKQEEKVRDILTDLLRKSLSYFDSGEDSMHKFLLGILVHDEFLVTSNRESGDGRYDILIRSCFRPDYAVIIECKYSKYEKDLLKDSENACRQIAEKRYLEDPEISGYKNRIGYGISFCKKRCMVRLFQNGEF